MKMLAKNLHPVLWIDCLLSCFSHSKPKDEFMRRYWIYSWYNTDQQINKTPSCSGKANLFLTLKKNISGVFINLLLCQVANKVLNDVSYNISAKGASSGYFV